MEKTQQYYIDEFYKFLESKEQGLSERFNGLCNLYEDETVQTFLDECDRGDFICTPFAWDTDDRQFWYDLHDQWLLHLEQL